MRKSFPTFLKKDSKYTTQRLENRPILYSRGGEPT